MLKLYFILMFLPLVSFCQQPFITNGGGAGLGEYGYLEKDAFTYTTLHRNTVSNIDYLSARFWVTDNNSGNGNGLEYVYHTYNGPDGNWNCNDAIFYKRTLNYAPSNFSPEWRAGSDVYVSVFGKQCPVGSGPWLPSAPNGSTIGYNEKHFQVIDIDNSTHTSVTNSVGDGNGDCSNSKVVASFVIDPGSISGLSLTRLNLWNLGSAQETNDIPKDGLKISYEPSTGSEYFSGNETSPANNTIWGDWNGDSQYNNIYEAANLTIPINGKTRIYIALCDLAPTRVVGRQVLFYINNDGMDFSPAQSSNGSTSLRIDYTNITNMFTVLPLNNIKLRGASYNDGNNIEMIINNLLPGTKYMLLQRSEDLSNWATLATYDVMAEDIAIREYYDRRLNSPKNYYRLQYISANGAKTYSYIIEIKNRLLKPTGNYELVNSIDGNLFLLNNKHYSGSLNIMVTDASARVLSASTLKVSGNANTKINIPMPLNTARGIYFLYVGDSFGEKYSFKFIR